MPYLYNTPEDQAAMLAAIGAASLDDLFAMVPAEMRLKRPLSIPAAMSEMELTQHMTALATKNEHAGSKICFLGGGSYDHFIPAVVDEIAGRGEFYTSYTPYQAEVSQGNLQVVFEYQTLIARMTGLDVSNASLYDGGSAAAEAVLMAASSTKRYGKVVTAESVHPEYRRTIATYLKDLGVELVTVGTPAGVVTPRELAAVVDDSTACIVIQQPNFFGCVEDASALASIAHDAGRSWLLRSTRSVWGCSSGRAIGEPISPWPKDTRWARRCNMAARTWESWPAAKAWFAGCRAESRAKRLTAAASDVSCSRCKPASSISAARRPRAMCARTKGCSPCATIYLSLLGPQGLRETANLCLQKSRYCAEQLCKSNRFKLAFQAPTFKEFVIRDKLNRVEELLNSSLDAGFLAGVPLGQWYPELEDCFLVAVTEKRTKQEIDPLVTSITQ